MLNDVSNEIFYDKEIHELMYKHCRPTEVKALLQTTNKGSTEDHICILIAGGICVNLSYVGVRSVRGYGGVYSPKP